MIEYSIPLSLYIFDMEEETKIPHLQTIYKKLARMNTVWFANQSNLIVIRLI